MGQSRKDRLRRRRSTGSVSEFQFMVRHFRNRANIVAEGDSWFDYPRKYFIAGKPANIIDWVQRWGLGHINLLRLASNADEATEMLSGGQRHKLTKILHECSTRSTLRPVDILLFSGGGNDVVGAWDIPRFLKAYRAGYSAADCLHLNRLRKKVKQIELAYTELVDICKVYSPSTVIITHTYDRIYPSDQGAEILGINLTNSWVKPYMDEKNIPTRLQRKVSSLLLEQLQDMLTGLENQPAIQGKLLVVDTMGTLTSKNQWLNEIHPTSDGFKKVAKKVYARMRNLEPALPDVPPKKRTRG